MPVPADGDLHPRRRDARHLHRPDLHAARDRYGACHGDRRGVPLPVAGATGCQGRTAVRPTRRRAGGRVRLRDGERAACAAARRERDQLPALLRLPLSADPLSGPLTRARNHQESPPTMPQTVARLLAESLEAHDIDQLFCVPGESYVGLTSALLQRNTIPMIVCRHEGGAGFMAVADGRLRQRAGCCIVSRGPGLSNAMVSLHTAYHDATPVVMLVGQVERKDFGRLALQEQNYSRLLSDVTKLVIEVNEPEQASEAIARAFHIAESGTQGPVAVILPEDIFDEETEAEMDQPRPRVLAGPRADDLVRLAEMLERAERPLVLVGGALLADAMYDKAVFTDLNRLAESWVLPINPTHRRPQLFDATHPNFGGYMGIRVPPALIAEMKRADLMVALGERMTDTVSQSYSFPQAPQPQLPFVHVWPDANEIGRVWYPDLGIW